MIHEWTAQNMESRHHIVSMVKNILLQSRGNCALERGKVSAQTLLWSEWGFDIDTSPQVIESFIFGDSLCSDDLGICISCMAHLERMIDEVRSQRLDAKASPTLIPPAEKRLPDCYHRTFLSENFGFARSGPWR